MASEAAPAEEILEGEIVSEGEGPRQPVARVARTVVVVVRHPVVAHPARHVSYVPLGAAVVVRRLYEARTTARFERHIRISEAAGDRESAREWEVLRQKFLAERHKRRMERRRMALETFRAAPWIAGGSVAVLGVTGIFLAIAERNFAEIAVPFEVVSHVVMWVFVAVSVSYGPVLLAAPWLAAGALWWTGKKHAEGLTSGWLAAPKGGEEDAGMIVTADGIVVALQHLPVKELKIAIKDGWRPVFHTEPHRDGEGYSAVFSVPMGVTAKQIADANPVFARNLHRAAVEVWATDAERDGIGPPGTVALWVANRGALEKGAPEWPLLHSGEADVFRGVPAGTTPRGDEILFPIVEANGVFGGMPGQGKSNDVRCVLLGCATDPLCEIRVFVFALNGDFDAFAPRLSTYVKGLDDAAIITALAELQELYDEVARREGRLSELGAPSVTRQIAQQHPDMRPIVTAFSECHELFGHKRDGKLSDDAKLAAELAVKTVKRGRKTGVSLLFDTQSSRKNAIPPELVENVSVNVCHAVKSWRNNDGFLGDGCFQAGIRATELRPGRDIGRTIATGVSDAQFDILSWHYIARDANRGYDAAADVIARCMERVDPRTAVASSGPRAIEVRDLLTDLDEVLEHDRVRIADLPARLRKLAPHWHGYRDLTGKQLRERLEDEGVRTTNPGNVPTLDPADLRDAIRGRGELARPLMPRPSQRGRRAAGLTR